MFLAGKPPVDIAYEMQLPAATIRAWSTRENWKEQKQITDAAPGLDAGLTVCIAKTVAQATEQPARSDLDLAEMQTEYESTMGGIALRIARHADTLDPDRLLAAAEKITKWDAVNRKALKLVESRPNVLVQIGLLSSPTNGE